MIKKLILILCILSMLVLIVSCMESVEAKEIDESENNISEDENLKESEDIKAINESSMEFDYGYINDQKYINESLGFWISDLEKFNIEYDENIGNEQNTNKIHENQQVVNLFYIKEENMSIQCYLEKINWKLGINDEVTYLNTIKEMISNTNLSIKIADGLKKELINNLEYTVMECEIDYDYGMKYQKYYSVGIDGYILNILVSYDTDQQEGKAVEILNSVFKLEN